jgi:hypothetical protein
VAFRKTNRDLWRERHDPQLPRLVLLRDPRPPFVVYLHRHPPSGDQ